MTVYTIYIEGTERYTDVSEDEFFDIMQDLAIDNYETGVPALSDISYTIETNGTKVKKSLLGTQFIEATPKKLGKDLDSIQSTQQHPVTLLGNGIVDKVKNESINHQSSFSKGLGS